MPRVLRFASGIWALPTVAFALLLVAGCGARHAPPEPTPAANRFQAIDRGMRIGEIRLVHKAGGTSGSYEAP